MSTDEKVLLITEILIKELDSKYGLTDEDIEKIGEIIMYIYRIGKLESR